MDFVPRYAKLPADCRLHQEMPAAAARLQAKLRGLDLARLDISDYIERSIGDYVKRLPYTLQKNAFVLLLATAGVRTGLSDMVFVDYGGGAGTLSMLAREAGVGTVIYSDIYDISCRDARIVARAMGCEADHYVEGEIDDLIRFVDSQGLSCDAVASVNVIEHIYDIDYFLANLGRLSSGELTVALSSTANPRNPARRLQLAKIQRLAENNDREAGRGHKERDTTEAYLSVRRRIIGALLKEDSVDLPDNEVELLAGRTRGMADDDIRSAVARYLTTGDMPAAPRHRTNTCDPYTGNWTEHLMDLGQLSQVMSESGFNAKVLCNYYATPQRLVRCFSGPLNLSIRLLGEKWGLLVAPSYILFGRR